MKKKSLSAKKITHNQILDNLNDKKISKVFNKFKNYLDKNLEKKSKLGVAVSGGADSLALAFLSKCYSKIKKIEAYFFIVDHRLRKNSSKEAKKVQKYLKSFKINSTILKWEGKKPESNIQGIARSNRYKILKKACKKNNINNLLIGHHVDDLYENFFIRLLRGSGLKGLASFGELIKENNISILRPLIKFEKKELINISKNVFQFYIEDPSNKNIFFQRIRIRNLMSHLHKEGLDKKKLNLTIKNLQFANEAINFYVNKNITDNSKFMKKKNIYILNQYFFNQPEEIILRSLSLILKLISGRYYSPRGKSIFDLILKIKSKKDTRFTLGGCFIKKVNKTVLISKEI